MSAAARSTDAPIRDWLRVYSRGSVPACDIAWMRDLRSKGEKLEYIRAVTGYGISTIHHYTRGYHPSEQPILADRTSPPTSAPPGSPLSLSRSSAKTFATATPSSTISRPSFRVSSHRTKETSNVG
ncbi:hypothetical protein SAMN05519103_00324 [Rhizobiales bacterium GAS113]|nr:hypothetical protein SAMN05519103_00324 [Rhizobiales bacterium GAS113]